MFFLIMIFVVVLSPLFIPVAVTVVHEFGNLRSKWADRRVPAYRPVFAPLPAAA